MHQTPRIALRRAIGHDSEPDGIQRGQESQRQYRAADRPSDQRESQRSPEDREGQGDEGEHRRQRSQDYRAGTLDPCLDDGVIGVQPIGLIGVSAAPIPVTPAITDAGGPANLLRRRPDLIVAERRLAASNARIGEAISEYYPKFSLSGLLGSATTSAGGLFGGGGSQAQGVLGLRWRLFGFGRVDAEIANARGRNAEALAAYRLAVLRASEDVEDAFSALLRREAQEHMLAQGETALARAQTSSLAAYKGGVVSLIEVLDADTRLLATPDARAQAQTEAARAGVASFRALGGGWSA